MTCALLFNSSAQAVSYFFARESQGDLGESLAELSSRVLLLPRSSIGRRLEVRLVALLRARGAVSGDSVRRAVLDEDLGLLMPVRARLRLVRVLATDSVAVGEATSTL